MPIAQVDASGNRHTRKIGVAGSQVLTPMGALTPGTRPGELGYVVDAAGGGRPAYWNGRFWMDPVTRKPIRVLGDGIWVAGIGAYPDTSPFAATVAPLVGAIAWSPSGYQWYIVAALQGGVGPVGPITSAGVQMLSYANGIFIVGGQNRTTTPGFPAGSTTNVIATSLDGNRWTFTDPRGYVGPTGQGLRVQYPDSYFNSQVTFGVEVNNQGGGGGSTLITRLDVAPAVSDNENWPYSPTRDERFASVVGAGEAGVVEVQIASIPVAGGVTEVLRTNLFGTSDSIETFGLWMENPNRRSPGDTIFPIF